GFAGSTRHGFSSCSLGSAASGESYTETLGTRAVATYDVNASDALPATSVAVPDALEVELRSRRRAPSLPPPQAAAAVTSAPVSTSATASRRRLTR
ncbi:MAG: hypothetical protein ACXW1S_07595, partial [Acidimicrobiia bacterium]